MEQVPAVLIVTTEVLRETAEHTLMHTAVADLGVEWPIADLVEDPDAELESQQ